MEKQEKPTRAGQARSIVAIAAVSLVLCGLLFPLVVTGVAQVFFHYQANGEIQYLDGRAVGSLVGVNSTDYTLPVFFHLRNDTASGFDPDITVQDAQSQIPGISNATGISAAALESLVSEHTQTFWLGVGTPYVNVQELNLLLVEQYPSVYSSFG